MRLNGWQLFGYPMLIKLYRMRINEKLTIMIAISAKPRLKPGCRVSFFIIRTRARQKEIIIKVVIVPISVIDTHHLLGSDEPENVLGKYAIAGLYYSQFAAEGENSFFFRTVGCYFICTGRERDTEPGY
jgi:hypothetical protein